VSRPILFGASYSVYVRSARLALLEKGVDHEHVAVDVFATGGPPAEYRTRHPFGKIPAFEHGDFRLYEAGAIMRYVDEAFAGPPLQPAAPRPRARMNQILGILDSYAYPNLVWGIYVEQVSGPARGRATDQARLDAAIPKSETCLAALTDLMGAGPFLAGDALSLADLHAAPMLHYFRQAPTGAAMLSRHPAIAAWCARMDPRPSMAASQPQARA